MMGKTLKKMRCRVGRQVRLWQHPVHRSPQREDKSAKEIKMLHCAVRVRYVEVEQFQAMLGQVVLDDEPRVVQEVEQRIPNEYAGLVEVRARAAQGGRLAQIADLRRVHAG